jgi:hypothetical protein
MVWSFGRKEARKAGQQRAGGASWLGLAAGTTDGAGHAQQVHVPAAHQQHRAGSTGAA